MRECTTLLLTALGGLVRAAQMTYYDAESTGGIGSCGNYIHNSDYSVAVPECMTGVNADRRCALRRTGRACKV
ncbi:hypothetical protein BC830DRAFT_1175288 [Chytriomyces sp. MP71]|nr:hypothetical protein BC830DRAFT_1175288 [Chytriomyces sp. MP71]